MRRQGGRRSAVGSPPGATPASPGALRVAPCSHCSCWAAKPGRMEAPEGAPRMPPRARVIVAAVAVACALAACTPGSDIDSDDPGQVEVFTWWATGTEKVGLDALVAVFAEQYPGIRFVNATVAGGAGSNAQERAGLPPRRRRPARHLPGACRRRTHRLHRGRPVAGPQRLLRREAARRRLPRDPHRPAHRRRGDLLGAHQHPSRQRRVGQHRGAHGGGNRPDRAARRPRRLDRRSEEPARGGRRGAARPRHRVDAAAAVRDGAARRPRRRRLLRPVDRRDGLGCPRGRRRRRPLRRAARLRETATSPDSTGTPRPRSS